jgi:hypothetical protein
MLQPPQEGPMFDLSPTMFHIVIAIVGLLLYLFVWRVTQDLPPAAKVLARMALFIAAVIPILAAAFFGMTGATRMKSAGGLELPAPSLARAIA